MARQAADANTPMRILGVKVVSWYGGGQTWGSARRLRLAYPAKIYCTVGFDSGVLFVNSLDFISHTSSALECEAKPVAVAVSLLLVKTRLPHVEEHWQRHVLICCLPGEAPHARHCTQVAFSLTELDGGWCSSTSRPQRKGPAAQQPMLPSGPKTIYRYTWYCNLDRWVQYSTVQSSRRYPPLPYYAVSLRSPFPYELSSQPDPSHAASISQRD
jgi:hypothetical protein